MVNKGDGNAFDKHQSPEKIQKEGRRLEKSDFVYYEAGDYYLCPMGQTLTFAKRSSYKKRKGRQYRASNCDGCKLKSQCLSPQNKSGVRCIFRNDKEHYERYIERPICFVAIDIGISICSRHS